MVVVLVTFLLWFGIWWIIGLLYINWSHWRIGYSTALVASLGSFLIDSSFVSGGFWSYQDPLLPRLWPNILLNLSIYPVGAWIFVQRYPSKFRGKVFWFFIGAVILIVVEMHLRQFGFMKYHNGWNIIYSFLANLFLLGMLRLHHRWAEQGRTIFS